MSNTQCSKKIEVAYDLADTEWCRSMSIWLQWRCILMRSYDDKFSGRSNTFTLIPPLTHSCWSGAQVKSREIRDIAQLLSIKQEGQAKTHAHNFLCRNLVPFTIYALESLLGSLCWSEKRLSSLCDEPQAGWREQREPPMETLRWISERKSKPQSNNLSADKMKTPDTHTLSRPSFF